MGILLSRAYKSFCPQEMALVLDRTIAVSTKGSRKGGTYDVFEVNDNKGVLAGAVVKAPNGRKCGIMRELTQFMIVRYS